jgi:hypothetical protein
LEVRTTNTLAGGVEAVNGSQAAVGDVSLTGVKADALTIETKSNVAGKVEAQGESTFRAGTVHLEKLRGKSASITSTNTLDGSVTIKKGSTVSVGNTNVGNEARRSEYVHNRGALTDSVRPSGLLIGDQASILPSKGSWPEQSADPFDQKNINFNGSSRDGSLSTLEEDLLYAYMSECSYGEERCKPYIKYIKSAGWEILTTEEKLGWSIEMTIFTNTKTGKMAVAFRGTEPSNLFRLSYDMITNAGSFFPVQVISPIMSYIQTIYKAVIEVYAKELVNYIGADNIVFVGHSKGGGEALFASEATGTKAVVFNPRSELGTGFLFDEKLARGYYVKGEALALFRFRDRKELNIIDSNFEWDYIHPFANHEMKNMILAMENELQMNR